MNLEEELRRCQLPFDDKNVREGGRGGCEVQWNLRIMDTLGTSIFPLFRGCPFLRKLNNIGAGGEQCVMIKNDYITNWWLYVRPRVVCVYTQMVVLQLLLVIPLECSRLFPNISFCVWLSPYVILEPLRLSLHATILNSISVLK